MTDTPFHFKAGSAPLFISIPHLGQDIPAALRSRMTPVAQTVADTDWHLDRLYAFAEAMGASILGARYSRYVIDLNRPPDDESLYPGQTKTGLCPAASFRGEPLYLEGAAPDAAEQARRLADYWQPYHDQLTREIARIKAAHGHVLLWEAHSIASVLPRLFDGKLPDLNIGTSDGKTCAPALQEAVQRELEANGDYTWAVNGRFKGGYITRHYGNPGQGVHAIQLEMCQSTYMDETFPFGYRDDLAGRVQPLVQRMVAAAAKALG
ncbi:N-formylglutamate deformylase [Bordetella genomosp. 1]|uniref:N-formylglutamate deformylase n=1 Tax=Bordetella genomosp. 1 TaxID=1395607 RepID=A0A261RY71_9BORD|nr:N-formylglutamate deformylase [Bordetella genomosp. 1]MDQ8033672.1 N-formylglutamate deformylase [Bordetella sp.]OZI29223.1 N-formylglutamate deformylase [Bordetella genomosp. 1]OZI65043.1 N-formylglutamate deformylase [Bordetella genomosp. 1]